MEFTDRFKNLCNENVPKIKPKTQKEKDSYFDYLEVDDRQLPEEEFIKKFY